MTLREGMPVPPSVKTQTLRQRVQSLYQQGGVQAQADWLLSQAFEELAHVLEELQAAEQALHHQREEWLNTQAAQKLENQRYKNLFEHAPAGYLVTSIDGVIRQANPAALTLLETSLRAIVGRSLAVFVTEEQRRAFRQQIAQVREAAAPQEWVARMYSWEGTPLAARLTVCVRYGLSGQPLALYWLMHIIDERDVAE